eukprot:CAMPEP_0114123360 /NCGR_PEP_ID=MMETSP0043_2-20121206/8177_1 /TAXON_ID=464988 /ORGANISM="Hemiselmis andersenii, Strain CCMP644" /LENGTH=83 /DNA_ID=CAMNT_0001216117 /DNA_START=203 /DNA_END=454 /DNA_ORIENTATION=+
MVPAGGRVEGAPGGGGVGGVREGGVVSRRKKLRQPLRHLRNVLLLPLCGDSGVPALQDDDELHPHGAHAEGGLVTLNQPPNAG